MDIRKLQRAIVDGLEDVKGQDILVLNTEHLSALFERVIIASGTSNRQTKALASSVRESVKAAGLPVLAMEGGDNGEWIIVDCGAAVAHIMQPAIRDYYRLEEIWGGKPVRMKSSAVAGRGLVKASEPDEDDEPAAPPNAMTDGKRRGAAPATAAAPPRKSAAKPAVAKRAAPKRAIAKQAAAKKVAAKKVAAKKAPAKKAPPQTATRAATRTSAGMPPPKRAPVGRQSTPAAPARTVVVKPRSPAAKPASAPARRPVAAKKTVAARPAPRKTRSPRG